MADRYLYSGSASESTVSPWYESTSTAAHDIEDFDVGTIATDLAVDEVIWMNNTHAESQTVAIAVTSSTNATPHAPQRLICVSDFGTNATPVSSAAGSITTNSTSGIGFLKHWFIWGINLTTTSSNANIQLGYSTSGPHNVTVETCQFNLGTGSAKLICGTSGGSGMDETQITINNCTIKFGGATNSVLLRHGLHRLSNLIIDGSSANPTSIITSISGVAFDGLVENSNFSTLTSTNLFSSAGNITGVLRCRNLKLASGITLCTDDIASPGFRFYADDVQVGTTWVPYYRRYYAGEVVCEQTILPNSTSDRMFFRDDDTIPHSTKLVGKTSAISKWEPIYSDWMSINVEDTATAITPFAEILVTGDGASALKDNQVWIEVDAMTTASSYQGTRYNDTVGIVASGTDQASGTITWTGHGYTTPRTHKLALGSSITPSQEGYIRVRVALATNTSIYIGKVGYS